MIRIIALTHVMTTRLIMSIFPDDMSSISACFCLLRLDQWPVPRASKAIHHLTFAPPPAPLLFSNQPVLICYNRSPSGPYYSNPCDVIPKQYCLLSRERRTLHYLTADWGISSLFLPQLPSLFPHLFMWLYFPCVSQESREFVWWPHQWALLSITHLIWAQ